MSSLATQDKPRFELEHAASVAEWIRDRLAPACARIEIAGSIRRLRPDVGDIEIVYVPKIEFGKSRWDFFKDEPVNRVDEIIADLYQSGALDKRKNSKGSEMFGAKNKLMRHVASGIPVDLFATTEGAWWNYLVCRTGGAENNVAIATAALAKGWKWHPYGEGFTDERNDLVRVRSEREVFSFVGLPYLEPWERS